MGYKSRTHYAQGQNVSDDVWSTIFNKCEHEAAPNIFPLICVKCNEWMEEENESKKSINR